MKPRVLSGIRATGRLHLGNYFGAVQGMLALQEEGSHQTLYTVVDAHTMTTPYEVSELKGNTREIIIDYLAAGLDPEKSILFVQSHVKEHFELMYYFSSLTSVARMQHLPTFKDKVKQHPHHVTMALLNYPVLMAADILVYKADLVPVGIDQEPHLEFAREIARKMNQQYGLTFPEPQRFATQGEYIPSLTGEGKMSKSVAGSAIDITDTPEAIRKKVRAVPTATTAGGEKGGGVQTLFRLLELLRPEAVGYFDEQFSAGTLRFVALKDTVADAIVDTLAPIQERRRTLASDPDYVDLVIAQGAEKAQAIARETVREVRVALGLE